MPDLRISNYMGARTKYISPHSHRKSQKTSPEIETKPETHTKNSDLSIGTLSKLNGVDPAVFADKL